MEDNKNLNKDNTEIKDPLLLDHNYDGIQELDYPLPRWWVVIFSMCIFFAILYFFYYQVLGAKNLREEYADDIKIHEAKVLALRPKELSFNIEKFNLYLNSKEELKEGEIVFNNNCVACHKEKGQGDIGPNLADEFWLNGNGNDPKFLHQMVMNGNEVNGMPPWKEILTEDEIYHTIAYVKSIKGIKLPDAKAPQGNKYE
ncbi:MAG: cbb3-type cytochrome c oxidase N-terminal domain-containing protein [Bacteriovoracaceae bacterium]